MILVENVDIVSTRVAGLEQEMQAQTQKMKGELLFEFKAKNNSTTIKDIGPSGIQLEMNDHGDVSGKYHAGHIDTVSVNLKTDGTNEWQLKLHFMTQSPKLAWLNNSTGWVEGQGNMSTGESSGKIYAKK